MSYQCYLKLTGLVLRNGCFHNGPVICPRLVWLKEGCIGPRQFFKLLNTHFKSVENITDGRFVPYITGCVVNLSMLFVIIYCPILVFGIIKQAFMSELLINVICYYLLIVYCLLHLFCRRFMSYQCYLLLFTPICFAGGSCLINVICYYLLHLFCRRFMSYQCYLLLFTPFVLQEVHVLSMLFVIIYSICFAGGSCLINVICYYLLHLFYMSYQCYLLLFTPFVLQVMSYQCYLLLFTPFVLQEVHVLSMLFVIIYSICFAGASCLINVICYYLLHLFCRSCLINVICYYLLHLFCRFMSYQCYLLLFTPFVLQEVHVLSMLFVIIYSICFAGRFMSYQCYLLLFTPFVLQEVHVLSMLFVIIYSICLQVVLSMLFVII